MKDTFSISLILGGYDFLFKLLLVFLIIDYITGILSAIYNRKLNSKVGAKGIIKKIGYIFIVIVASLLDLLLGDTGKIRDIVIYMFIVNESISIIENWTKMGIKIPRILKKSINDLENEVDDNEISNKDTNEKDTTDNLDLNKS